MLCVSLIRPQQKTDENSEVYVKIKQLLAKPIEVKF